LINKIIERLLNRKRAYRRLFLDQDGNIRNDADIVLADLKRFCRATGTTAIISPISKTIDPLAMAMAEGRREVWNRIQAHLHIEDKVVLNLKDPNDDHQESAF
jgi:hypothetical protein